MQHRLRHYRRMLHGWLALMTIAGGLVWANSGTARPAVYIPPACSTVLFHSEPLLQPQRVCMNLGVKSHPVTSGTYLFVTPHSSGSGIFRPNGALVWWHPLPRGAAREENISVVTLWGHQYLAIWSGESTRTGSLGSVRLYDQHYQPVGLITAGGRYPLDDVDLHEFRITPQGNALIGIWETVPRLVNGRSQTVIQYVVQELSLVRTLRGIRTSRVLFQWNSLSQVPLSESRQPQPTQGAWDYFHGNSVAQDFDGNLIISGRNTWAIYKISRSTGRVMWEVGGRGDHTLTEPWCDQHDVTPLGGDEYSVFDDGGSPAGCAPGVKGHPSRAIIFRVNPSGVHPPIRLVRAYTHTPPTQSGVFGSVQALPSGDVLVDWGSTPEVTEYAPTGRQIALDLSLSFPSYRAFESSWVGEPTSPPAVAARLQGTGTEVWASWNGSTQVAAWRVLAGSTPSHLTPATAQLPKTGFETAIALSRQYSYVSVQALTRGGYPLGRSSVVAPTRAG